MTTQLILWSLELAYEFVYDFFSLMILVDQKSRGYRSDLQAWINCRGRNLYKDRRVRDWEEIQHHERVISSLDHDRKEFGSAHI